MDGRTDRATNILFSSSRIVDCIKEMDVTSVTSPIGLWTAARKPIVLNLGSAILKISGACWEKNNTDCTYMGMRRGHGQSGEVAMVTRAGSRGHWSINLSIRT